MKKTLASLKCPKCSSPMQDGFLIDLGAHPKRNVQSWHANKPAKSIWIGVKTSREAEIEVQTFRCTACGFLESYAL